MYYYPMTKARHAKVTFVEPKPAAKTGSIKPKRKRYHKKKGGSPLNKK